MVTDSTGGRGRGTEGGFRRNCQSVVLLALSPVPFNVSTNGIVLGLSKKIADDASTPLVTSPMSRIN